MAYCNGKAPSQQAGNPLHSCENGRLVKTWRMGSPGLVSSYLEAMKRPFARGKTRSLGDLLSPWLLTTY